MVLISSQEKNGKAKYYNILQYVMLSLSDRNEIVSNNSLSGFVISCPFALGRKLYLFVCFAMRIKCWWSFPALNYF